MGETDLFTINLAYLAKARELLAAGERRQAQVLLGVSEPLAEWLEGASVEAVLALARCGLLCFQPRVPDRVLRDAGQSFDDAALLRYHAALAAVAGGQDDDRSR